MTRERERDTIVVLYVPRRSCVAAGVDATCGRWWYGNLLRASFRRARVKSAASSKPGVTTADESGTLWGYGYRKTTRSHIAIESQLSGGSVSTATVGAADARLFSDRRIVSRPRDRSGRRGNRASLRVNQARELRFFRRRFILQICNRRRRTCAACARTTRQRESARSTRTYVGIV